MSTKYASGKWAISECDRCGFRFKLKQLSILTVKTKPYKIKVCPECWEKDHPQLQLGMYPVFDPQAIREPRPDVSYYSSGTDVSGYPSGGSRMIQWGWNPVGGPRLNDNGLTPNYLVSTTYVGDVTISIT